jgi:RimJ/RimL family protein N-acetyltransferase
VVVEIHTERLVLRRWRDQDRAAFAALNADPAVMEHFASVLSREASDQLIDHFEAAFRRDGFGFWAVTADDSGRLLGMTGLGRVDWLPQCPAAVEIGWRFARSAWGYGYATEAAKAALRFGHRDVSLPEIVSFTATTNIRSQRVMQRIGMVRDQAGDFDRPGLPVGHRLRRHVMYRSRFPSQVGQSVGYGPTAGRSRQPGMDITPGQDGCAARDSNPEPAD